MRNLRFIVFLSFGIGVMIACSSCSTCSRSRTADMHVDLAEFAIDSAYFGMAKNVIYALPTPVEMSILIKNSGIDWRSDLLNDPANVSRYMTHQKMALNFGVYLTDLTYAGLFQQSQSALRYKLAINHLVEGLGLHSAINANTMQSLEENINDKDKLLEIIADTYASCMASLDESDRYSLTLSILTGGWTESMYIATGTLNEKLFINEEQIKQLVINQILTFDMMWQVISELENIPDMESLISDLSGLAKLFDTIAVDQTENVVTEDIGANVSKISSTNFINLTPEDFEKIKIQVQILRQKFINI